MLVGVINPAGAASGDSPSRVVAALERTSVIRHAIEALIVSELDGVTLARSAKDAPRMGGLALVRTGREVLERLGVRWIRGCDEEDGGFGGGAFVGGGGCGAVILVE